MIRQKLRILLELVKIRITFAVSLTTATGYILYKHTFDITALWTVLGLFLLACGSAVINHIQEFKTDMLMTRTQYRPIPSQKISKKNAWLIALLLVTVGSLIILFSSNILAMFLGWLALIWYNLIYTPMKKMSAFAPIPGAVIGAIPPMVGWVAAGGYVFDYQAFIMAFFFFIWQVPHFWLLVLKHGKEYEAAGFPAITTLFTNKQIKKNTFIWIISTAISALMFAAFKIVDTRWIGITILLSVIWLIVSSISLVNPRNEKKMNPMVYFRNINIFVLIIMIFLSIDSLT